MNIDLERERSLFEAAREISNPVQRRAFLEAGCEGDATLLSTIENLLSAGERADEFFADCMPTPAAISAILTNIESK